jgi:hypothetical protein
VVIRRFARAETVHHIPPPSVWQRLKSRTRLPIGILELFCNKVGIIRRKKRVNVANSFMEPDDPICKMLDEIERHTELIGNRFGLSGALASSLKAKRAFPKEKIDKNWP